MKKIALLIGLVSLGLPLWAQAGGLRYSIQVTKFENKSGWNGQWDLGDGWGAVLTDRLQQSGRFIVVGEQDMRAAAMDEQDLASSGRVAGGGKAPVTGQMTPAQLLVKGTITAFDEGTAGGGGGVGVGKFRVGGNKSKSLISGVVYVVDSTTGSVTASKNFEATITKAGLSVGYSDGNFGGDIGGFKKTPAGKVMGEACEQVVGFLTEQLASIPWSGTIVKGGSDNIIINRGSREGLAEGLVLRVGKTEAIRDPDSGELLDSDFTETAKIQVTKVKEKIAYAKLTSGTAPKKGDAIFQ